MAGEVLLESGPVRLRRCRYGPMLYFSTDRIVGAICNEELIVIVAVAELPNASVARMTDVPWLAGAVNSPVLALIEPDPDTIDQVYVPDPPAPAKVYVPFVAIVNTEGVTETAGLVVIDAVAVLPMESVTRTTENEIEELGAVKIPVAAPTEPEPTDTVNT